MSDQPTLPGMPEFKPCIRCGQEPEIRVWDELEPGEVPGMNVSCRCRTISGEREGMAAVWNRAAMDRER